MNQEIFQKALSDPIAALNAIEKLEAERDFLSFIKNGWEAIEPGQKFVSGWAVEAICEHLQAVTEGEVKRLLINVPPGCTKSMTTSVFWPAWEWGPRKLANYRYILAAHEQNLAIRDNVRCRDLMLSEWYRENWSESFSFKSDVNSKIYYENNLRGWRMASSVGSGLTGYRGDRLLLDDPHSVKKADSDAFREDTLRWFSETLPTRLNNPDQSAIVVIMQRVHERDVSGLILAEELGYEHLMLPMEYEPERCCYTKVKPKYIQVPKKIQVSWDKDEKAWRPDKEGTVLKYKIDPREKDGDLLWPERFSEKSVEELKKTLRSWGGGYAEAGQLQQRPAPRGGGMFQEDDWVIVGSAPETGVTVRGWDFAGTDEKENKNAAFTVGAKVRYSRGSLYILDIKRKQVSPSGLETMLRQAAHEDGVGCVQDMPQDPGQAGKAQKVALGKLLNGFVFQFSPETGSKVDRAQPLAAQAEIHNVFLVKGAWNAEFIKEAKMFPNGKFKDQIDAVSRAYSACLRKAVDNVADGPEVEDLDAEGEVEEVYTKDDFYSALDAYY
ncbi:terminase [Shewanella phage S0112]|nr:terminase [Shewanella phage S0112]